MKYLDLFKMVIELNEYLIMDEEEKIDLDKEVESYILDVIYKYLNK
jgi:hypothetical protein